MWSEAKDCVDDQCTINCGFCEAETLEFLTFRRENETHVEARPYGKQ